MQARDWIEESTGTCGVEPTKKRLKEHNALNYLKEHERKYLSMKGLSIYSPKYKAMLENINF